MKFTYTGIPVRDFKSSIEFYTKTMRMKEVQRGKMQAGGIFVQLKSERSPQILELNYYPPGTKFYEEYVEGSELDHLAFWCNDVRKSYEKVLAGGATSAVEHGTKMVTHWHLLETMMEFGLNSLEKLLNQLCTRRE